MTKQNRNILFVDDDPKVIHGLRRSTAEYEDEWNFFFANSGQDALSLLASERIDVLVTDIRMPVMDGIELLGQVANLYPQVIRFALSGNSEFSRMLQSTQLVHQFIAKPCDFQQLHRILEQSCHMRDLLQDPQLIQLTTGVVKLPSIPILYTQLLQELQTDEPNTKRIGEIINRDVSMTAKILQLVNSAFFSYPGTVTDPQRAVAILGVNTIKALVLGIQVFNEYQGNSSQYFSIDALWKHSTRVGQLTWRIAQQAGLGSSILEKCQVTGLLHDIGKLLELRIPGFFKKCKINHGYVTLDSELQLLGTTHAQLGAYLLAIWGLPNPIVEAIALHHQPEALSHEGFGLTTAIHIANGLHYLELIQHPKAYEEAMNVVYLESIGITRPQLDLWAEICQTMVTPS